MASVPHGGIAPLDVGSRPHRNMLPRPIVVLGAPRSGTTILHRCLSLHPELWHLAAESHNILEGPLHPAIGGYSSNRAVADQLSEEELAQLRARFYDQAINLNAVLDDPSSLSAEEGGRIQRGVLVRAVGLWSRLKRGSGPIRFVEKTPKNSLRVPFLDRLFPDALFVWIRRNAATNIDSLIAGWLATSRVGPVSRPRFARAGYPIARTLHLQDYHERWWKFALVPGWRELVGATVADVALLQYYQCNQLALTDLASVDSRRVLALKYEEFTSDPVAHIRRIFEWAELAPSPLVDRFAAKLPRVNDATPGFDRSRGRLRYPDAVHAAMARRPAMRSLVSALGYAES
ncbi:MAG TPA: sulfotransferase [Gemmatimonadaceae bacterium]|nr:sulfotransferase [Gemmatimonadaceae bacterium]